MATHLSLDRDQPDRAALLPALTCLRDGGVCAVPTDTVYGLAANAWDPAAVEQVFTIKGRGFDKPLPLAVRDLEQARQVAVNPPPDFFRLAAAFWPGPLTLIVAAAPQLPPRLTAGSGRVGMRQPDNLILRALLAELNFPLTATSANRSGEPECTTAAQVEAQLGERLALVIDGGPARQTTPSTILDLHPEGTRVVRAGAIPLTAVAQLCTLVGS